MSNPVTPVVISTIQQAQAQLESEQLASLLSTIQSSNVLSLPNGATVLNIQSLSLSVLPNGSARLNISIKS